MGKVEMISPHIDSRVDNRDHGVAHTAEGSVCILTSAHAPTDIRIFAKEARSLREAGYKVTLVALSDGAGGVKEGINVVTLPHPKNRLGRFLSGPRLLREALRTKARFYHFHDPDLLPIGAALKLFSRSRVIYDVHEHYPNAILHKYWIPSALRNSIAIVFQCIERLIVPMLDAVVYTTPIVGERYLRLSRRAVRIENYPRIDAFPIQNGTGRSRGVVFCGKVAPERGVEQLLDAVALLDDHERPDVTFLGDFESDEYRESVMDRLHHLGLSAKVTIAAPVSYKDLGTALQDFRVGVVLYQPTPNNMSCLPNKLFEYMAAAIPVLASDFPLYREVIQAAECGVVVDPTQTVDIAAELRKMVKDDDIWRERGLRGRQAFRSDFNWNKEGDRLVQLYSDLSVPS
jgi:glycosyltransferase involved in cell wall biosynthesis